MAILLIGEAWLKVQGKIISRKWNLPILIQQLTNITDLFSNYCNSIFSYLTSEGTVNIGKNNDICVSSHCYSLMYWNSEVVKWTIISFGYPLNFYKKTFVCKQFRKKSVKIYINVKRSSNRSKYESKTLFLVVSKIIID